MKETRTINLNGLVYHIDYDAYVALRDYLQDIEMRLPMEDKNEIIQEIEARIAELFSNTLFAKNVQVVSMEMVEAVQTQIGDPSEFGPNRKPKIKSNKSHNSGCGRILGIVLNVMLAILALPAIFFGMVVLFAIVISLFGVAITGTTSMAAVMTMVPVLAETLVDGGAILIPLLMIALVLIIVLPIVMVVKTIVTYLRTRRGPKARFWWISILFWLASIVCWGTALVRLYHSYDNAPEILKAMTFEGLDMDDEGSITSALQLDGYHSIQLRGAAELQLQNAATPSTTLTTNLLMQELGTSDIRAEVRDSILFIETPTNAPVDNLIARFTIASSELRNVTVYGAGKIENADDIPLTLTALTLNLNGTAQADLKMDVQTLIIDAKGASKLELEGLARDVDITIAGAGELDAEDLRTEIMHINCAGASKAEINVNSELWAQATGASKITYTGTAQIKQKMAVGGSVIIKD